MYKHLELSRDGHLEQVLHIMVYLKNHIKIRLVFDSIIMTVKESLFKEYNWVDFYWYTVEAKAPNMPEARGRAVTVSLFVDDNHYVNKLDRGSQTAILIFINRSPIH